MLQRTITITLPEALYTKLEAQAHSAAQQVDEVVVQTLAQALPPDVEPDLPTAVQEELQAMERLSDEALWAITRSVVNEDRIALYDTLIERHIEGTLTPEGQRWLAQLRSEADALMLRKAHAYMLLKARNYPLPSPILPLPQMRQEKRIDLPLF